jgi:NodT family efflux transporter outer membrane factor (OMF) lipoprotein
MRRTFLIAAATVSALLTSCMVGPDYTTPKTDFAQEWTEAAAKDGRAPGKADPRWWRGFQDPTLDQLIEVASRNNLTLQVAGVRILEARARLNKTIGELFPQQQGISGQVAYTKLGSALASPPSVRADQTTDQALFAASWEIDFWGKYRRAIESDRAAFLGSLANYDDAMVTLIGDVANSYVNIRTFEERLRVAQSNVEAQKESLRIAEAQFKAGATGERDVQQATTQLAQTEAQIPGLQQSLRQAKNALALLLGETPDKVDGRLTGTSRIPKAPESVATGVPHDLLRRRPDVRAAELSAASASALIGVAKADLYPSFTLSGQFGFAAATGGSGSLSDIANWPNRTMGLTGGFFMPLFNYGRLINQVRVQDAQFQEAALNYRNTVLSAQREVEDGLAAFSCQRLVVAQLTKAAEAARRSTTLAMVQYRNGQTDYTTVILAEQTQLEVEDALASAQGNVVLGLVSVYRALGGGWEIREGRDVISDEVKEEMKQRTKWGRLLEPAEHLPGAGETRQTTGEAKP